MFSPLARLRHNVIKTGVRIISLSYSRISLDAIADKLGMDSADDAEYIVAKCIRDGVIDATIDHQNRYVASKVRTACQVASLTRIPGLSGHFWAYVAVFVFVMHGVVLVLSD